MEQPQEHHAEADREKHRVDVDRPEAHLRNLVSTVSNTPTTIGLLAIGQVGQVVLDVLTRVCVAASHVDQLTPITSGANKPEIWISTNPANSTTGSHGYPEVNASQKIMAIITHFPISNRYA